MCFVQHYFFSKGAGHDVAHFLCISCVSRGVCPERCPGGVQGMCVQGVCLGAVWGCSGVCVSRGVSRGCQGGVQGGESRGVCPGGVFRGVSRGGTPQDP